MRLAIAWMNFSSGLRQFTGQTFMQRMQQMQRPASTTAGSFLSMALVGHSLMHMPQSTQASLTLCGRGVGA